VILLVSLRNSAMTNRPPYEAAPALDTRIVPGARPDLPR
jgi:hypothetical protein